MDVEDTLTRETSISFFFYFNFFFLLIKQLLYLIIFNCPWKSNVFSYPRCSGALAPGLAADMHAFSNVIAYVGPACAFALEPVARLAAYWNIPIITGMGDQARHE